MSEEPVRLRPIEEADLDTLRRFDTDPSSRGPHLSSGFRSPQARRRRWEEDGWLGAGSAQLAVILPDGTLAGIVSWRSIPTGGPEVGCLEIGALLFPEHRGQGRGTAAQRLLVVRDLWSSSTGSCRARRGLVPLGCRPAWRRTDGGACRRC